MTLLGGVGMSVKNYTKKRFIGYIFLTIFIIVSPFITIDGNHLFLLSFVHQKLNILFVSFSVQELYLMPFLLIILFLSIFFVTTLLGRVWCAWACPQTIFRTIYRDIIQTKILKLYAGRKNKQQPPRNKPFKKVIGVFMFYIISAVAISNFMWYFVPPEDFFEYLKNPFEHTVLFGFIVFGSLLFTFDITYLSDQFCVYVCPYARIQSAMYDADTKQILYDESRGGIIYKDGQRVTKKPVGGECVACEACVKVCPNHIDIRKGIQLDCINCLECVDVCSKTQARYGRESLINWTSIKAMQSKGQINYFRFRTVAYMVILSIILTILSFMATTKTSMLLNINRTSELYSIKDNGDVRNAYVFLFGNTDNHKHKFYFDVIVEPSSGLKDGDIVIHHPRDDISIDANGKRKKIVVLSASKLSNIDNKQNNVIIPIKIKAYAKDDDKIFIIKDTRFIYPKQSEIDKATKHKSSNHKKHKQHKD